MTGRAPEGGGAGAGRRGLPLEPEALDALADLIAREIIAAAGPPDGPGAKPDAPHAPPAAGPPEGPGAKLDAPNAGPAAARPGSPRPRREPPGPLPPWSRPVGPIAPGPETHLAAREAASRRGIREIAPVPRRPTSHARSGGGPELAVPIGVAARYVLLSDADWRTLFGTDLPAILRELRQPGTFACRQTVRVVGPTGDRDRVRVLGPFRRRSRVGLCRSDARRIGVDPPVRQPEDFTGAVEVTLVGPAGSCAAPAVVPGAHIHLPPDAAAGIGLRASDRVAVRLEGTGRSVTLHDVPILITDSAVPELHVDADEAHAAGVWTGDNALIARRPAATARGGRRPLLAERDVDAIAARGETLSAHSPYLITPAARDRARRLGIWRDRP